MFTDIVPHDGVRALIQNPRSLVPSSTFPPYPTGALAHNATVAMAAMSLAAGRGWKIDDPRVKSIWKEVVSTQLRARRAQPNGVLEIDSRVNTEALQLSPEMQNVVNLYIAFAPRPPTEEESIWIAGNYVFNLDYTRRVCEWVSSKRVDDLSHPKCEIYFRHMRSKRRQIFGPEPPTDAKQSGRPLYAVSSLFPGTEYNIILEILNGPGGVQKKGPKPLVPLGAPIVNGIQSLISIAPVPGDEPIEIARNIAYQSFSTKLVEDLELIGVKDLMNHGLQTDRYLICRTIDRPALFAGIFISVADPAGDVIRLELQSVPIQPTSLGFAQCTEYDAMFPLGTILLIKEPYFDTKLGQPRIQVYSPTDVEIISLKDPLVTNQPWKMTSQPPESRGAIELRDYERLGVTGKIPDDAWEGLAVQFVLQALAKGDAGKKRKKTLGTLLHKAMLLSAVACYSRRHWKAAIVAFKRLCERYPDSPPGQQGARMAEERLKERETGQYDWYALYNSAKASQIDVQIGDYIGPVEEREIPGMGKGLVATRDIRAGELLMAERAVELCGDNIGTGKEPSQVSANVIAINGYLPRYWALGVSLLYKAYWQPEVHKQFKALYSGINNEARQPFPYNDETDYRGAAREPIDARAVDAIAAFNLFGTSVEGGPMSGVGAINLKDVIAVGADEAKRIANAKEAIGDYQGLFPYLCLFNNSCKPNCQLVRLSRVMAVKASEDIPAGTELTVTYNPEDTFAIRCVKLERLMGVPCACSLCKDDALDGMDAQALRQKCIMALKKRQLEIYPDFRLPAAFQLAYFQAREKAARVDIEEMLPTYGKHRDGYRPDLADHYEDLSQLIRMAYMQSMDFRQIAIAIDSSLKMLRCSGVEIVGDPFPKGKRRTVKSLEGLPIRTLPYTTPYKPIQTMVELSVWYMLSGDVNTGRSWRKAAETVHAMTSVPCLKVFQDRYGEYGRVMELSLRNLRITR